MSKAEFRKKVEILPNTLTKLNQNENVSLEIIVKTCEFLNCDIGDVCEGVKSKEGVRCLSLLQMKYNLMNFI